MLPYNVGSTLYHKCVRSDSETTDAEFLMENKVIEFDFFTAGNVGEELEPVTCLAHSSFRSIIPLLQHLCNPSFMTLFIGKY